MQRKPVRILEQFQDYAQKVGVQQYPAGTTFTPTGFLEFSPRDAATQAKYDAMSPQWEGVSAAESAITRGLYDLDTVKKPKRGVS